ncbi:Uncharacterised protein [Shigella sonnei]|nr:Uncharacterised protein [Shigella sonnei]CSQ70020.1 Uncharacterised protein [Shigella sonnei]
MQLVDFTELIQHCFTKLKAVSNGQRLHHIEHGVVDIAVTAFAHATNQVRGVLGLCQIFCRSTGCTFG